MPVTDKSLTVGLSVALVFAAALVGVTYWVASKPREDVDQSWQQWLSNRRIPAGHGWWQLTGLDGAVELGHMNGTANGTTTATARNTAQVTTPATADDTVTCAASGTAAATSDATADATTDITANGAASGPH